jgi:hypothetical protein
MSPREHIAGHMSSKVINKRQAEAIIFDTVPVTNMLQSLGSLIETKLRLTRDKGFHLVHCHVLFKSILVKSYMAR